MAVAVATSFTQQEDINGVPYSGAKVYVYAVGTTTPSTIQSWSTGGGFATAANPIICDSSGRHDMRYVGTNTYKIVVKTSADVTIYTRDNIDAGIPASNGAVTILNGGTGQTSASQALIALGGATAASVALVATDVATASSQITTINTTLASVAKWHLATGTTAQRDASPAEGDIRRNTTLSVWEGFVSTWKRFLTEDDLPVSGSVVQTSLTSYTASSDLTTVLPYDNTIPLVAEGTEIISVSFTPTNSSNKLRFTFQGFFSHSGTENCSVGLWGAGNSSAIAASACRSVSANDASTLNLCHEETAGTTSPKTFTVRVGPETSGTMRMNGTSAGRRFGGVAKSTLIIEEIKV